MDSADDRLQRQLQRLYLMAGADAAGALVDALPLLGQDGRTRALLLEVGRCGDWERLAELIGAVQDELDLPMPVVSVLATGGYRLWFSLAEAVPLAQGLAFLDGLRRRYLADLPEGRIVCLPQANQAILPAVPACDGDSGRWSAFIDPGMGAMFADEPGLDLPPGRERQADLLGAFSSMSTKDFTRVLGVLQGEGAGTGTSAGASPAPVGGAWQHVGTAYAEPRSFLLAVMNDPTASAEHRLRAAEVLLQHRGD